jgi:hypothetical protein
MWLAFRAEGGVPPFMLGLVGSSISPGLLTCSTSTVVSPQAQRVTGVDAADTRPLNMVAGCRQHMRADTGSLPTELCTPSHGGLTLNVPQCQILAYVL